MKVVESGQEIASQRGALLRQVMNLALDRLGFAYPGEPPVFSVPYLDLLLAEQRLISPARNEVIKLTLLRSGGYINAYNDRLEIAGSTMVSAIGATIPVWGVTLSPQELSKPDHALSYGSSQTRSICEDPAQLKRLIANLRTWTQLP